MLSSVPAPPAPGGLEGGGPSAARDVPSLFREASVAEASQGRRSQARLGQERCQGLPVHEHVRQEPSVGVALVEGQELEPRCPRDSSPGEVTGL